MACLPPRLPQTRREVSRTAPRNRCCLVANLSAPPLATLGMHSSALPCATLSQAVCAGRGRTCVVSAGHASPPMSAYDYTSELPRGGI